MLKNTILDPVLLLDLVTGNFSQLASDAEYLEQYQKCCCPDLVGHEADGISSAWQGIKTTVVNLASSLREAAVSAFRSMVSTGIGSVVFNGFSAAIRFITGLPGQAFRWGQDFIQGLINGISSMIQGVINTVSGLAERAVRDVALDMVISPRVNGMEYGAMESPLSGWNMSELIYGFLCLRQRL